MPTHCSRWMFTTVAAAVCSASLVLSAAAQDKPAQTADKEKQEQFQLKVKPAKPEADKADEKPAEKPADEGKPADPGAVLNGESSSEPSEKVPVEKKSAQSLPDFRKTPKNENPDNLPPYDRLNPYGVLPSSSFDDGGSYLPVERRVPEVFQHLDPRDQIQQGKLLGSQLPPVLLEYRILNKEVRPGEELRATARLSAVNKPRPFTSLYTHVEYGRRNAAIYVNFEPSKKDPNLFLGRGTLPKYLAAGRYVIGDTIIGDENGHRKAYWPDWNPVLQEADGSPIGFVVPENPDADNTPPRITKLEMVEKTARVGDNIHLNIWVEDDKSGVNEAQAYWISPSGDQSLRADLISVPNENGKFVSSFQIPEYYEGGLWKLLSIRISDQATNELNLFPPNEPMLRGITVNVQQDPAKVDKTPPRLLGLQLSHKELDRDKELSITMLVEDEKSGMSEAYISFLSPYGADFNRVKLTNEAPNLNRRSQMQQVNVFRGTLKLKPTQEPGKWTVSRVNLADVANNYANYNAVRDDMLKGLSVFFSDPRMKKQSTTEDHK